MVNETPKPAHRQGRGRRDALSDRCGYPGLSAGGIRDPSAGLAKGYPPSSRSIRRAARHAHAERHTRRPGDLALVGSETDVIRAMTAGKWSPADPITFRSSVRIAVDSVFRRPDADAPVSVLELFGRKQDLAFEQPVGDSPRQRHHVRFWHWDQLHEGREVWFGSVTFDERVGLSHTTGQVTHHIGPDLDAERDRLMAGLQQAGVTQEVYWVDGFQQLQGKNGGGDPWHTDGRLGVALLVIPTNKPASPQ
jgi:LssY C-terminus